MGPTRRRCTHASFRSRLGPFSPPPRTCITPSPFLSMCLGRCTPPSNPNPNPNPRQVHASFREVMKMGVDSIPVVIFECQGLGEAGVGMAEGRIVHHGSGSASEFRSVLERLHAACGAIPIAPPDAP